MKDIFKRAGAILRGEGFRGSGQRFRKDEDDFVFIVGFQRSRLGDGFFVNLGAQPTFIPAECSAPLKTLKDYECVWRDRVGIDWPPQLDEPQFQAFAEELVTTQRDFFGHARTFPIALASDSAEALLDKFGAWPTRERASLHLARAALALNRPDMARQLATIGLELTDERGTGLLAELRELLARC